MPEDFSWSPAGLKNLHHAKGLEHVTLIIKLI